MISPLDWSALVEEAVRRRKAEGLSQRALAALAGVSAPTVIAFERGDIRLRFERVAAILDALGLFVAPRAPDRLQSFVRAARARFDARIASLPTEHPSRMLQGYYEWAYAIEGADPAVSISALRVLLGIIPKASGWTPFWVPTRMGLRPTAIEGALECWLGSPDVEQMYDGPGADDFWRYASDGRGYLRRGLVERDFGEENAVSAYALSVIRHAAAMARALGGDEKTTIRITLSIGGGAELRVIAPLPAGSRTHVAEVTMTVEDAETDPRIGEQVLLRNIVSGREAIPYVAASAVGSSGPFAVTRETVAGLDDVALRDLVRRLLEAEAGERGIPATAIDVGGAQTAPDGGIDASIHWVDGPDPAAWLPRRHIVVQCKATTMAPASIEKEMRPKGVLRPIFETLVESSGAYIITTTEDVGSNGIKVRLDAMRAALDGLPGSEAVALDIYGADKLARWTNSHVGVAMWLREISARDLMGWRPFGSWSNSGDSPYLVDEAQRVSIGGGSFDETIGHAIGTIRRTLAVPRGTIRLVGISGMGKTRLAEALFDERLDGTPALSPSLAVYGDAGLALGTPPATVAERLAAAGQRAVLVVDNCTARLHGQLAEIVARRGSRTALLTIDYELDGDIPDGTHVVRLGDNSDATIEGLIAQRFPDLGEPVRQRLTEFAGGNARIALAIARGVNRGDALSDLDDTGLIERLFQEERRGGRDATMRPAAEAAALVYAFHADATGRVNAEHGTLALLAGLSPDSFYAAVERMLSFGIAQQRGSQRAIKPDALADTLAGLHLGSADPASLIKAFAAGPPRLFASFARRIGRLHHVPKAVAIAKTLLAPDGWLGSIATYDATQRRAFVNVAAGNRKAALDAIGRSLSDAAFIVDRRHHREYADILAHIAWDSKLFSPAMTVMITFVTAEPGDDRDQQVRRLFLERFRPGLSFTMADGNARLAVVDTMLDDKGPAIRDLALDALDAMLETAHISSSFQTDFGTRNQHSEWRWQTVKEHSDWFSGVYERLELLAMDDRPTSQRARSIIAENARSNVAAGLGIRTAQALRTVHPGGYWDGGWRAANDVLHFDRTGLPDVVRIAFEALERDLRPHSLEQCFEAFVLGEPWRHWHPRGDEHRHTRDVQLLARGCGVALARSSLDPVPWLGRATGAEHAPGAMAFGRGLVSRADDLDALWSGAVAAFRSLDPGARRSSLLSGIIDAAWRRDRDWTHSRLVEIAADPDLAQHIVALSPRDAFDAAAVDRLIGGLGTGTIPPARIGELMYGGVSAGIAASDLARLLGQLIEHPDGAEPALNILFMRRFGDAQDKRPSAPELEEAARKLLVDVRLYDSDRDRVDHELAQLARSLFPDVALARGIARAMSLAERDKRWRARDLHELKKLLIDAHLEIVLDELVATGTDDHMLDGLFDHRLADDSNIGDVDILDEATILRWIGRDPQARALKLAALVPYAVTGDQGASLSWSPLALAIVSAAPDAVPVLAAFEERFYSGASSGPFYLRFERRLPLIDTLLNDREPSVRNWARETRKRLEEMIERWQEREREGDSLFE